MAECQAPGIERVREMAAAQGLQVEQWQWCWLARLNSQATCRVQCSGRKG